MSPVAYPFIKVDIDTSGLRPAAQRNPGVIAVIGDTGGAGGSNQTNVPIVVDDAKGAAAFAAQVNGVPQANPLYNALLLALEQVPAPSKVYAIRANGTAANDWEAALIASDGIEDVDFVAIANVTDAPTLSKVRDHVEQSSQDGRKRMGVGMVDAAGKSNTYVADLIGKYDGSANNSTDVRSGQGRMILVAARGAILDGLPGAWTGNTAYVIGQTVTNGPEIYKCTVGGTSASSGGPTGTGNNIPDGTGALVWAHVSTTAADVGVAAMAAIAGYAPSTSIVLKPLNGFHIPNDQLFNSTEIKGLSNGDINPVIPSVMLGLGLYFGQGATFTKDTSLLYVDLVRTLDDIDFRLKAGLIGLVGDARITRAGLTTVKTTVEGILAPLKRAAVIDDFFVSIPVLDILNIPESARNTTDNALVATARLNRAVDLIVNVTYGPAVHQLLVKLQVHV
jgi:hypothetical protein